MPDADNTDKQSDDNGASGEGSAPQNKTSQDSGNQDDNQIGGKAGGSGAVRDITKLREERRQLRDENGGLKSDIAELKEMLKSQKKDPDESAKPDVDIAALEQRLLNTLAQRDAEATLTSRNAKANEMFGKLRWVAEDDSFGDVVQDVMHSQYAHVMKNDPVSALKLAYKDVCSERGVSEDYIDNSPSRASGGAGGSASKTGGAIKIDPSVYNSILNETNWSDPVQAKAAKAKLTELKKGRNANS